MDVSVKVYVHLNETINQFVIMVIQQNQVIYSDITTRQFLNATIDKIENDVRFAGFKIAVYRN